MKLVIFIHTRLEFLSWLHPYHPMYRKVASAAAVFNVPVIESFEHFRGQHPETLWVSGVDSHPNAEGHRILATALADGLERLPEEYFLKAAFGG